MSGEKDLSSQSEHIEEDLKLIESIVSNYKKYKIVRTGEEAISYFYAKYPYMRLRHESDWFSRRLHFIVRHRKSYIIRGSWRKILKSMRSKVQLPPKSETPPDTEEKYEVITSSDEESENFGVVSRVTSSDPVRKFPGSPCYDEVSEGYRSLPFGLADYDVIALFAEHVSVKRVEMVRDKYGDYAFVSMATRNEAVLAGNMFHGKVIRGSRLSVAGAYTRSEHRRAHKPKRKGRPRDDSFRIRYQNHRAMRLEPRNKKGHLPRFSDVSSAVWKTSKRPPRDRSGSPSLRLRRRRFETTYLGLRIAPGTESASVGVPISKENKGFKLLTKMGWNEGEGLNKERRVASINEPLAQMIRLNESAGLGAPCPMGNLSVGAARVAFTNSNPVGKFAETRRTRMYGAVALKPDLLMRKSEDLRLKLDKISTQKQYPQERDRSYRSRSRSRERRYRCHDDRGRNCGNEDSSTQSIRHVDRAWGRQERDRRRYVYKGFDYR